MKYGIISDIHGNLSALEAALRALEKNKIDRLACLGDIIGYGPQPNECVDLVFQNAEIILAGNHEHAALGKTSDSNFNIFAKAALTWTRKTLTDESIQRLHEMNLAQSENDIQFVHSTPGYPEYWSYLFSPVDAKSAFLDFNEQVCFIGHSHVPVIFRKNATPNVETIAKTKMGLKPDQRAIINVGSVGQPRDMDARAAFGIYDSVSKKYSLLRKRYDISETQLKMQQAGLPECLATRLKQGQ